ncbi:MAG: hypothetical protein IAG13_03805, partial [Deltaproteobacteria bacterium]|nr:hypothetical protein [Nannocystaceae bacterium]
MPPYARLAGYGNLLCTNAPAPGVSSGRGCADMNGARRPGRDLPRPCGRTTGTLVGILLAALSGPMGMGGCGKDEGAEASGPSMTPSPSAPTPPAVDDDALAMRYLELRAGYDAAPETYGGKAGSPELTEITAELRAMSNEARDVHLRANAALLLGAMHQARGGWEAAAGAYRRAAQLVPEDAGPHMALARALSETKDFKAAAEAQLRAVELDPDNLEQYLALGELRIKAGDNDSGAKAYADYEVRRRGLIDGLTLKHEGAYKVSVEDRIGCAESLAVAADVGTAFALLYALEQEPEPKVRAAIVRAMGSHRFVGYKARL